MDRLTLIINTLCRVEVRGRDNLARLLGCIRELENMREENAHEADDPSGTDV